MNALVDQIFTRSNPLVSWLRQLAFYGSILDAVLRWNGVKTVVVVGLGAAVGVVPTLATGSNLGHQGSHCCGTDEKHTYVVPADDQPSRRPHIVRRSPLPTSERRRPAAGARSGRHTRLGVHDELKPATGDIVLPVYRPDAFFGTPVDPILKCNGVKTVVLLGIHADTVAVQTLSVRGTWGTSGWWFRMLPSRASLGAVHHDERRLTRARGESGAGD